MKNLTLKMNWLLVVVALIINILWYAVKMGGYTGFQGAWYNVHPVFAIFLSCIWAYFFIALFISAIKKW